MYRNLILCSLALVALVAGCTSAAAVGEQRAFRLQTANLYEHQVWDNLCRVYSQRLLVQLRFDSVTGTVNDTLGSTFA